MVLLLLLKYGKTICTEEYKVVGIGHAEQHSSFNRKPCRFFRK